MRILLCAFLVAENKMKKKLKKNKKILDF